MRVRFHLGGLKRPLWSREDAFEAPQCYPGANVGSHKAPKTNVAVDGGKSKYSCKTMLPAAEVLNKKKSYTSEYLTKSIVLKNVYAAWMPCFETSLNRNT